MLRVLFVGSDTQREAAGEVLDAVKDSVQAVPGLLRAFGSPRKDVGLLASCALPTTGSAREVLKRWGQHAQQIAAVLPALGAEGRLRDMCARGDETDRAIAGHILRLAHRGDPVEEAAAGEGPDAKRQRTR